MPIGIPKVPFRLPGESSAQWTDLYNRLYRERFLFLGSELDDELANQLVAILLYLNGANEEEPIYLYINSPGGSVICGVAVSDAMNHCLASVSTICVGIAASMASFVLTSGEPGRRIGLPHSRVMIHQPQSGSKGQSSEITNECEEILRIRREVARLYAERTSQSIATIIRDMDRDLYMSAKEAKDYGLLDSVVTPAL